MQPMQTQQFQQNQRPPVQQHDFQPVLANQARPMQPLPPSQQDLMQRPIQVQQTSTPLVQPTPQRPHQSHIPVHTHSTGQQHVIATQPQPALPSGTDLPPGWEEIRDPDGKLFYYYRATKLSVWTKPVTALPAGWIATRGPDGRTIYSNAAMGLSQYERPGTSISSQTVASSAFTNHTQPPFNQNASNSAQPQSTARNASITSLGQTQSPSTLTPKTTGASPTVASPGVTSPASGPGPVQTKQRKPSLTPGQKNMLFKAGIGIGAGLLKGAIRGALTGDTGGMDNFSGVDLSSGVDVGDMVGGVDLSGVGDAMSSGIDTGGIDMSDGGGVDMSGLVDGMTSGGGGGDPTAGVMDMTGGVDMSGLTSGVGGLDISGGGAMDPSSMALDGTVGVGGIDNTTCGPFVQTPGSDIVGNPFLGSISGGPPVLGFDTATLASDAVSPPSAPLDMSGAGGTSYFTGSQGAPLFGDATSGTAGFGANTGGADFGASTGTAGFGPSTADVGVPVGGFPDGSQLGMNGPSPGISGLPTGTNFMPPDTSGLAMNPSGVDSGISSSGDATTSSVFGGYGSGDQIGSGGMSSVPPVPAPTTGLLSDYPPPGMPTEGEPSSATASGGYGTGDQSGNTMLGGPPVAPPTTSFGSSSYPQPVMPSQRDPTSAPAIGGHGLGDQLGSGSMSGGPPVATTDTGFGSSSYPPPGVSAGMGSADIGSSPPSATTGTGFGGMTATPTSVISAAGFGSTSSRADANPISQLISQPTGTGPTDPARAPSAQDLWIDPNAPAIAATTYNPLTTASLSGPLASFDYYDEYGGADSPVEAPEAPGAQDSATGQDLGSSLQRPPSQVDDVFSTTVSPPALPGVPEMASAEISPPTLLAYPATENGASAGSAGGIVASTTVDGGTVEAGQAAPPTVTSQGGHFPENAQGALPPVGSLMPPASSQYSIPPDNASSSAPTGGGLSSIPEDTIEGPSTLDGADRPLPLFSSPDPSRPTTAQSAPPVDSAQPILPPDTENQPLEIEVIESAPPSTAPSSVQLVQATVAVPAPPATTIYISAAPAPPAAPVPPPAPDYDGAGWGTPEEYTPPASTGPSNQNPGMAQPSSYQPVPLPVHQPAPTFSQPIGQHQQQYPPPHSFQHQPQQQYYTQQYTYHGPGMQPPPPPQQQPQQPQQYIPFQRKQTQRKPVGGGGGIVGAVAGAVAGSAAALLLNEDPYQKMVAYSVDGVVVGSGGPTVTEDPYQKMVGYSI
jgi:hypothetical protein